MQPNPLPKPAQQLGPQAKSWPLKDTPSTAVKGIWVTPEHNSGNDQDPPQSRGKCDSEDNLYGEVRSTAPLLPAPLQPAGPHLCTWVLTRPSGSVRLRRRADTGCLSVAGGTRGTGGPDRVGMGVPCTGCPSLGAGQDAAGTQPVCVAATVSLPGSIKDPACPAHRTGGWCLHLSRPTPCLRDPASRERVPQTPLRGCGLLVPGSLSLGPSCPSLPPCGHWWPAPGPQEGWSVSCGQTQSKGVTLGDTG